MENDFTNQEGLDIQYRSVSKSAVASLIFSILGLSAFLAEPLIVFPLVALAFALIAWINFRKHREELIGKGLIYLAAPLALACFLGALAHHLYVYRTEVPEGYRRISFAMLRDNPKKALKYSELAPELDGEKVFLRGYVRPGDKKRNLKHFIMVGDFGSCCFGGSPKISEVVAVSIDIPDKTVNYGYALRRIGGTFRFLPETASTDDKEVPQVYYHIIADHIK
jgi:hypothetical protein